MNSLHHSGFWVAAVVSLISISQSFAQTASPTPCPGASNQQCVSVSIPKGAAQLGSAAYGTNPLVVPPNTQVTWTNTDSIPHTVTADDNSFHSGLITPGGTFQHLFTTPGTYPYKCTIIGHNMQGTVQVVPTPTATP